MEEQKNQVKEVKMQPSKGSQENVQKLSYDQLKDIADKLWNENRYLRQELQKATDFANTINRLDYLLKIVEIANHEGKYSFSSEFIINCISEVEKVMSPSKEDPSEEEKGN